MAMGVINVRSNGRIAKLLINHSDGCRVLDKIFHITFSI